MRNTTLYKLARPVTFRRSSTKLFGYGGNLQNIEKSMRALYLSDGWDENNPALIEKMLFYLKTGDYSIFTEEELEKLRIMLQVDQSGAEALIVAYDCNPGDYRKLFENNVKPHVYVALKLFREEWVKEVKEAHLAITKEIIDEIYNTKIEDLKKNPSWKDLDKLIKLSDNWIYTKRYYYYAKQTVHSANYDIQGNTFIMNVLEKSGGKIALDIETGNYFLLTYRSLFPEIPERNQRVIAQVNEYGIIYNMFGMPYQITNENISGQSMKDCLAWGPQSTVGEITRIAFSNLQEYIEDCNKQWDILADTHDSYMTQCKLYEAKESGTKMKEFMNQRLISPIDGTAFNMRSELQVGFNWAPEKKDNQLGLREVAWL